MLRRIIFLSFFYLCLISLGVSFGAEPNGPSEPAATEAPAAAESGDDLSHFGEAIVVDSASRRRERITEAPAAVTAVSRESIERQSSHGQIPKLLRSVPGIEITQSGLYNFNLNLRGFNIGSNRRVLVLVDGRNPSMPFLDAQEWANFSIPLFELDSAELLHGPSSALYGSNAVNGVLNLATKRPSAYQGGRIQLTGGELDTRRFGLRYADTLGRDWFYRLAGGAQGSKSFARSRDRGVEYPGAPPDGVPLPLSEVIVSFGSARLDKELGPDGARALFTLEGGTSTSEGVVFVGSTGRFQRPDSRYSWMRLHLTTSAVSFLGSQGYRRAEHVELNTGGEPILDVERSQLELQAHTEFSAARGRLVVGLSYTDDSIDSADDLGNQTLLFQPEREDGLGVFSQIDYDFGARVKAVAAARWDKSNRHEARISPKVGLIVGWKRDHHLRLTYNEAFQAPNTAEFFGRAGVAIPLDLSPVEEALAPVLGGVELGLANVPLLAAGNSDLVVEKIRTFEVSYSTTIAGRHFFVLGAYSAELEDFVSAFLPREGTSFGRINPSFGFYQPPAELSAESREEVLSSLETALGPELFPLLSNDFAGAPILAIFSPTNVGRVVTSGVEASLDSYISQRFRFRFRYAHFDFDVREEARENPISPNAPRDKLSMGLSFTGERLAAAIDFRWVSGFDWREGVLAGEVPSYGVADLSASYDVARRWTLGVNVSNLLDDEHFEIFGGDLLRRRALVHATYTW